VRKSEKEIDFLICDGLKPKKIMNVTYEVGTEDIKVRELTSLAYFQKEIGVEGEIVSMYPFKVPKDIKFLLAHRFLR
jgi:hypothetical protein